ncbi:hypothetical protein MP638_004675 [Amoeboaphelidium occidentale]|nr:hypothetical protein MP638_004675 [Amoeboaphelidium occidentale]
MTQSSTAKFREVVDKVFRIYTTKKPEEQMAIFDKYFNHEEIVFEDPLSIVHGREQYRLVFVSLIKLFSEIDVSYNPDADVLLTSVGKDADEKSGNYQELLVRNVQTYKFAKGSLLGKMLLPDKVQLKVETTIGLKEGKVVLHSDYWSDSPFASWVFRQKALKRFSGNLMCRAFKAFGW